MTIYKEHPVCARWPSVFVFDPDDSDQLITAAKCDISYDNYFDIN